MRKLFKLLVFVIPISLMFASCYPGFDATVEELDIAITQYDSTQDFTQLNTFYMYDTIVYIGEEGDDIDESQEDHIFASVYENLIGMGWTEDPDTVGGIQADVSITISALKTDIEYYYYYWYDYWYWYPWYPYGAADASTNYFYPIYPVYPSYSCTIGSVLIDMVNVKGIIFPEGSDFPSGRIPIVCIILI